MAKRNRHAGRRFSIKRMKKRLSHYDEIKDSIISVVIERVNQLKNMEYAQMEEEYERRRKDDNKE